MARIVLRAAWRREYAVCSGQPSILAASTIRTPSSSHRRRSPFIGPELARQGDHVASRLVGVEIALLDSDRDRPPARAGPAARSPAEHGSIGGSSTRPAGKCRGSSAEAARVRRIPAACGTWRETPAAKVVAVDSCARGAAAGRAGRSRRMHRRPVETRCSWRGAGRGGLCRALRGRRFALLGAAFGPPARGLQSVRRNVKISVCCDRLSRLYLATTSFASDPHVRECDDGRNV